MSADYEQNRKEQILEILKQLTMRALPAPGEMATSVQTFHLVRLNAPHQSRHCLSLPMVTLLIQGHKQIDLASDRLFLDSGKVLVTCVDVPSTSVLTNVSPERPLLSMYFMLDKKILAELLSEMPGKKPAESAANTSVWVMEPHLDFLETFLRLTQIALEPERAIILGPLLLRELHYLLLAGPNGAILQELYMRGAKDNRIIDAIAWLKQNVRVSISVEALARKVNMSVSSLHRHFKLITGYSPLQYHKKLRLYEAQRLMLAENERADIAALAVGYESITQFNREYKRMFGEPPHRDITRRKNLRGV